MLRGIGLEEDQTRVYRALVARPSATAAELAPEVALPSAQVEAVVGELEALGLVARQGADPGRVVPSPPRVALGALLAEQERRLATARSGLEVLEATYRDGAAGRSAPDVVDLVLGGEAVRQRFAQLQAGARDEVRAFVRADAPFVSADENAEEDRALLRGVRYRIVVERPLVDRPGFLAQAAEVRTRGETVRVAARLPTRLLVVDGELALLPMRRPSGDREGAILVHPSSLLDLLVDVFESTWVQAARLTGGETAAIEPLDRSLLTLLLVGLTDTRIAGQLGVSPRTVQRRVTALMGTARVATRFQLGAEAVRRGWV